MWRDSHLKFSMPPIPHLPPVPLLPVVSRENATWATSFITHMLNKSMFARRLTFISLALRCSLSLTRPSASWTNTTAGGPFIEICRLFLSPFVIGTWHEGPSLKFWAFLPYADQTIAVFFPCKIAGGQQTVACWWLWYVVGRNYRAKGFKPGNKRMPQNKPSGFLLLCAKRRIVCLAFKRVLHFCLQYMFMVLGSLGYRAAKCSF